MTNSDQGRLNQATQTPYPAHVKARLEAIRPHVVASRSSEYEDLIRCVGDSPVHSGWQQWVGLDLMSAFDPEASIKDRGKWLRWIATYSLFLPLVVTWLGLHGAITAYEKMTADKAATFFEQWLKGFGGGWFSWPMSLSTLALVVAASFLVSILFGVAADLSQKRATHARADLRGALADSQRLLQAEFPASDAGQAGSISGLATQVAELASEIGERHRTLVLAQEQLLTNTATTMTDLSSSFSKLYAESTTRMESLAETYANSLSQLLHTALAKQEQLIRRLAESAAVSLETTTRASELVLAMEQSTSDFDQRRAEYDRVFAHLADAAMDLRESVEQLRNGLPKTGHGNDK